MEVVKAEAHMQITVPPLVAEVPQWLVGHLTLTALVPL